MPNSTALTVSRVEADAVSLASELGDIYTSKQLQTIFNSVAAEARTLEERRFVVMSARAMKVDLLRGECHVLRFTKKIRDAEGKTNWVDTIQVVKDYNVDLAAARAVGFLVSGAAVCVKDLWDGWDAVACRPVKHVMPGGDRGKVIGAWARGENPATRQLIGSFFEWDEMVRTYRDKNSGEMVPIGMWGTNPATMAEKAACQRVARRIVPNSEGSMETEATATPIRSLPPRNPFPKTAGLDMRASDSLVEADRAASELEAMEAQVVPNTASEDEAAVQVAPGTPWDGKQAPPPEEPPERPATAPRPAESIVESAKMLLGISEEIARVRGGGATRDGVLGGLLAAARLGKGKGAEFADHLTAIVNGNIPEQIQRPEWYSKRVHEAMEIQEAETKGAEVAK